jgi:hypothetical protein
VKEIENVLTQFRKALQKFGLVIKQKKIHENQQKCKKCRARYENRQTCILRDQEF